VVKKTLAHANSRTHRCFQSYVHVEIQVNFGRAKQRRVQLMRHCASLVRVRVHRGRHRLVSYAPSGSLAASCANLALQNRGIAIDS
jgi:hypothetical protein